MSPVWIVHALVALARWLQSEVGRAGFRKAVSAFLVGFSSAVRERLVCVHLQASGWVQDNVVTTCALQPQVGAGTVLQS